METILTFRLVVPFWSSFRVPTSINVHLSYPFPPFTTLYGLINSARGKPQDWQEDRKAYRFGLVVLKKGYGVEGFSKIMKISRSDTKVFDHTIVIRQKLLFSQYQVYVKGENSLLEETLLALQNPHWPLFLGESDDLVDLVEPCLTEAEAKDGSFVHSIIQGVVPNCSLVSIPVRFEFENKRWAPLSAVFSIPPEGEGVSLPYAMKIYTIGDKSILFHE